MKCFSYRGSEVFNGLPLTQDERLGNVVFLGEQGRGRHYEKVALGRRNSAEIIEGRVLEAHPIKISLPAKDGKPEKVFFVLEKGRRDQEEAVLIKVNTLTSYVRGARGYWEVVAGQPEELISGHGAFGDAGRIGSWKDGLLIMRPGDVLKIHSSRGEDKALWMENGRPVTATWQDYENILAVAKVQELVAQADEPELAFGMMPAFTFDSGRISEGLAVSNGATGRVVTMGEKGRGRHLLEVPIVGHEPGDKILEVAVVKLSESPEKTIYGITESGRREDAFLVRVCTESGYTRRGDGSWKIWKGGPVLLDKGWGADGDAGRIGQWDDGLFVMREGDVLYVSPSGDGPSYAVFTKDGRPQTQTWLDWKLGDAKSDPNFYVAKGTAPWGYVPTDWIGRVVTTRAMGERRVCGGHMEPCLEDDKTGELISVNPLVLNLGWDGRDRHDVIVGHALWIVLTKNEVRRLEGEDAEKRQQLRGQAEALRAQATEITRQSCFGLAPERQREQIKNLACEGEFDTMKTEGMFDSLKSWIEKAEGILHEWAETEPELKALEQRQGSGQVLVDFGGHFRRMGASGNSDFWVVCPDGSLREPDEVSYRKRYTTEGDKSWRVVADDELAISWDCGTMNDVVGSSRFQVAKAPVGGCTKAQQEAVARIELELEVPANAFGLNEGIQEKFDHRLDAIEAACASSRVIKRVPDNLDYLKVSGSWGQQIDDRCIAGFLGNIVDWQGEFNESVENREAQVIDSQPVDGGVLEFLAYEKWGGVNLNIRWQEMRAGESVTETETPEVAGPVEPPSADALEALKNKWGR